MRKISIEKLITKSINRTKLILFQPFALKKWLCLLLIAYLSGAIGGGGNFSGGGNQRSKKVEASEQEVMFDAYDQQAIEQEPSDELLDGWTRRSKGGLKNKFAFLKSGIALGVIGVIGFFVLAFMVFFTWLSSRFKFIWFNSIVTNDASIEAPFKKYKKEGNSLFKFLLIIGFIVLGLFGLLAFWVYSNAVSAGVFENEANLSFMQAVSIFALPAVILILGITVLAVISVLIDHFTVTIMAMEHCSFGIAWRKVMGIVTNNTKDIILYLLVLLGLGVASGILATIVAFVCILVVLLVAGLLLGIPFLLIVGIFKAKILFTIFAIIVGIPLFVLCILLFFSIGLPFAVFFRSLSLYFISSLDCGYRPLLLDDNIT